MNEKISNVARIVKSVFFSGLSAAEIDELNQPVNSNVVRWYMIDGLFGDLPVFVFGAANEPSLLCVAACAQANVNLTVTQIGFHCRIRDGLLEELGYEYDDVWHLEASDTTASPFSGNVVAACCRNRKQLESLAASLAAFRPEYSIRISKYARIRFIYQGNEIKSFQEVPYSNMQESEWL